MKKIVAVGGGTGMPILIRSLLPVAAGVDAIVTVADDGGSSGRLRDELDGFPPGDGRNCLVAMADESVLTRLFQYRFKRGETLKSHALGNLIISALMDITGDFSMALEEAGVLIGARGRVMPPSLEPLTLYAKVEPWSPRNLSGGDQNAVVGQCNVANRLRPLKHIGIMPDDAKACPKAVEAIGSADLIILGPGSLFTSVMANLLVEGIREAVSVSPVKKVFLCNITEQRGETDGLSAADHLLAIQNYTGVHPDLLISSNTGIFSKDMEGAETVPRAVTIDPERISELGADHIAADLTESEQPSHHDHKKLTALWREIL